MTRRTSMVAYQKIKTNGLLTKARMQVYEWLFENGPATATDIEVALESNHAHKRLSELRDQSVVDEVGERKCLITDHTVILWDVTENLPLDPGSGGHGKTRKQVDSERDWLFGECLRLKAILGGTKINLDQNALARVVGSKLTGWETVEKKHSGSGANEVVLEFDNGRNLTIFLNELGELEVWK